MYKIEIIARPKNYEELIEEFIEMGIKGMTVTQVMGRGNQKLEQNKYRGVSYIPKLLPKVKVEVITIKDRVDAIISKAESILKTGNPGDGKIFVYEIDNE